MPYVAQIIVPLGTAFLKTSANQQKESSDRGALIACSVGTSGCTANGSTVVVLVLSASDDFGTTPSLFLLNFEFSTATSNGPFETSGGYTTRKDGFRWVKISLGGVAHCSSHD